MMSCSGWIDEHFPLSYEFYLLRENVKKPICLSFDPVCIGMVLPMGDPLDGYRLPVYVSIIDNIGGRTDINFTVTVSISRKKKIL